MANIWNKLFGKSEKVQRVDKYTGQQQDLFNQMLAAIAGGGAGGAAGTAADFYRDLLSGNSQTQQQMEAPLMRQFQEEIIPSLSAQFAGLGSGGLSSSAFRNAGVRAGTDLGERLGAIRAGLRMQGAQGLMGLTKMGLEPSQEILFRPETYGLAGGAAEAAGKAAGTAAGYSMMI